MSRRIVIGISVVVVMMSVAGLLVWAGSQGLFRPHGKSRRLLVVAEQALQQGRLPEARASLEELIATWPDSPWVVDALLQLGVLHEREKHRLEARATYRTILQQFPGSSLVTEAQTNLSRINMALLFSPIVTELDATHHVKPGGTLGEIARLHQTTVEFLTRANQLASGSPPSPAYSRRSNGLDLVLPRPRPDRPPGYQ